MRRQSKERKWSSGRARRPEPTSDKETLNIEMIQNPSNSAKQRHLFMPLKVGGGEKSDDAEQSTAVISCCHLGNRCDIAFSSLPHF